MGCHSTKDQHETKSSDLSNRDVMVEVSISSSSESWSIAVDDRPSVIQSDGGTFYSKVVVVGNTGVGKTCLLGQALEFPAG